MYKNTSHIPHSSGASDTEIPSYFLSSLGNLITSGASSLGSLVSNGASALGNLVSKVPVVGNVVGGAVNSLGSGLGQLVSGNVTGGLGSLYHGADKLVGGFLPNIAGNGIAPAQGWMASLYNTADNALGGYLPNFGGGFGSSVPAGNLFGMGNSAANKAGMSTWDKLGTGAQVLQAGANLYGLLNPQGNAGAYQQAAGGQVSPVLLGKQGAGGGALTPGGNMGGAVAADPAMQGVAGGGNVPTISQATGGKPISDVDVKKNGDDLSKAISSLGKNRTQKSAEDGLGIDIATVNLPSPYDPSMANIPAEDLTRTADWRADREGRRTIVGNPVRLL